MIINSAKLLVAFMAVFLVQGEAARGQNPMPEVLDTGTIREQFDYINNRTRIYENYRAIREDMFQKLRTNVGDTLNANRISNLQLRSEIDKLSGELNIADGNINTISIERDKAINERDSITLLGITMHKTAYNSVMWTLIAGLLFLTGFMFLVLKRALAVTRNSKIDLEDIKREFENFRKVAHENKEKLILSHFNEIKKLKERGH